MMKTDSNEETLEFYKKLKMHPVGTPKEMISHKADITTTDVELVGFYSEKYVDMDIGDLFLKGDRKYLFGLGNMVKYGEFYLDVGCANGENMELLHQKGIKGIGLDISIPNILRGRVRYSHLMFIHGFAEEIPFKDDYFDVVLLGDAIEHFRGPKAIIAECLRVAKIGLIISFPINKVKEKLINPFTEKELLNLLEFYKLSIHFFNYEGGEITKEDAIKNVKSFKWLLIRAEKTPETKTKVKEVLNSAGNHIEIKAKDEILNKDQWSRDTGHIRKKTEIERFKLVSCLIEGNKVLEIGCGNGDSSVEIAKNGFDVVGIDISESGIKQAIEIAAKENVQHKTNFLVMDATSLLFSDNSFDSIVIPEVFEHIRSPRKLIEEAIRVVRNGGRIIISVPDGLLLPYEGHLRIFFKDTLTIELNQYADEIEWYQLPFKGWIICSFFVRKKELDIQNGPLVDILMPTFNGRKIIEKAIKSVLNQTYTNWNLIIINDGGEDINDFIKKFNDNRLKYIQTENKGKSHALNAGINKSFGEYIAYLDDDDIFYPIHLEFLVKNVLEKKNDFVYSDWYLIYSDENLHELRREIASRFDVTPAMLIYINNIFHNSILHKRSLIEIAGMYDETLNILIDWDMIRRLAFISKPYHILSFTCEHVLYYKNNTIQNKITGLWNRNPEMVFQSIEKIVEKTKYLSATNEELNEAIRKTMMSMGYYHLLKLNNAVQEVENSKNAKITYLETTIQSIHQSIIWRLVIKCQNIIELLLPLGTKRRYYYDMGILGLRNAANRVWRIFDKK